MIKQAWYTYLTQLRPRNIKNVIKLSNIYLAYFRLFFIPSVMQNIIVDFLQQDNTAAFFFAYMFYLPLILMKWSNRNTRLHLPKRMFLSPMGIENRKKYITALIFIKIGVPTLLGLLLRILYVIKYGFEPLFMVGSTIAMCSFGIGTYLCSEMRINRDELIRYAIRDKNGIVKNSVLNWICMIVSIIMLFYFDISTLDCNIPSINWNFLIGATLVLLLFDGIIVKRQFHSTIENICNYEIRFNILTKLRKFPI